MFSVNKKDPRMKSVYVSTYVCMYVCMYLCMYVCICMYGWMDACIVCMYVYIYVCMYVCACMYVCIFHRLKSLKFPILFNEIP